MSKSGSTTKSKTGSGKGKAPKQSFEDYARKQIAKWAEENNYDVDDVLARLDEVNVDFDDFLDSAEGDRDTAVSNILSRMGLGGEDEGEGEVPVLSDIDQFLYDLDTLARTIRLLRSYSGGSNVSSFIKTVEKKLSNLSAETARKVDSLKTWTKFTVVIAPVLFSIKVATFAKGLLTIAKELDNENLLGTLDVHIFTHDPAPSKETVKRLREKKEKGLKINPELTHFSVISVGNSPKPSVLIPKGYDTKQIRSAQQIHLVYSYVKDRTEIIRQDTAVMELQRAVDHANHMFSTTFGSKDKDKEGFAYGAGPKDDKEHIILISNPTIESVTEIISRYHYQNLAKAIKAVNTRKVASPKTLQQLNEKVIVNPNQIKKATIFTPATVAWVESAGLARVLKKAHDNASYNLGEDEYNAVRETVLDLVNQRRALDGDTKLDGVKSTLIEMGFAIAGTMTNLGKFTLYTGSDDTMTYTPSTEKLSFKATKSLKTLLGSKVKYTRKFDEEKGNANMYVKGKATAVTEVSKTFSESTAERSMALDKKVSNMSVRADTGEAKGIDAQQMTSADIKTLFNILEYQSKYNEKGKTVDLLEKDGDFQDLRKVIKNKTTKEGLDARVGSTTVDNIRKALGFEFQAVKEDEQAAAKLKDKFVTAKKKAAREAAKNK